MQRLFCGGFAVLVAAFSLNSLWFLSISIVFMLVEVLFLKGGAYEHHWWRLYMTGFAAFVILTLTKKWLSELQNKHQFLRKFTIFMIAWVILQGESVVVQSLLDLQHFLPGFVPNDYQDSILFSVPYQLCLGIIYSAFASLNKRWYYLVLPLVLNALMDSLFTCLNILNFYNGWNLFYFEVVRILGFVIFILLEKYTLRFNHII